MWHLLGVVVLAVASAGRRCWAASVEAGTLTTVVVDASSYDARLSAAGGCDPAGCSGDKTRVGPVCEHGKRKSAGSTTVCFYEARM